jgi:hypothetical protein
MSKTFALIGAGGYISTFSYLEYEKWSLPVSEQMADLIFSLSMHPCFKEEEQSLIPGTINLEKTQAV